ncbi:hypothetical protein HGI30_01950 [Paenibacillus albicereus]|uniref:Uncharacterized protein n=1 Tax=Paenibacillus albicereus TaxID=2726185 RepID=A0A6H2GSV0_9BACL|nr:hypothetical protein [Paenibacillus albicereus]QJC50472.1 hypothetical protein HGI30_01950 [Paenibacillus albicereus]
MMEEQYLAEKLEQFRQERYRRLERQGIWRLDLEQDAPAGRSGESRLGRTLIAIASLLSLRR